MTVAGVLAIRFFNGIGSKVLSNRTRRKFTKDAGSSRDAPPLAEKSMDDTNRTSERADIREYLRPLLRRWWLILGIALAVTAVTYYHFSSKPPRYTASTNMLIQSASLNSVITGQVNYGGDPERAANNQAALVQSEAVAERVAKKLGFRGDPRDLLGAVSVTPVEKTDFIQVIAQSSNPKMAAALANEFASAFKAVHAADNRREAGLAVKATQEQMENLPSDSREYELLASKLERLQVLQDLPAANVKLMDPAVPPAADQGPDPVRNAIFGFVVALLLGGGAAYALESLDRRIRRASDVEPLYGVPVLAELPHARETGASVEGRLALPRPLTESFRGLRTNLQLKSTLEPRLGGEELRSILVASAVAGEGKSTIVRNLAIAYREAGVDVVVVDADLRKPTISRMMVEDPVPGLLEVLTGSVSLEEALRPVELHVEGLATISRVQQAMENVHEPEPVATTTATPAPYPHSTVRQQSALRRLIGGGHAVPPAAAVSSPPAAPQHAANGNGSANGNGAGGRLLLLPSGAPPADPGAVLASKRFRVLLGELSDRHDVVLIDSSPLLPVSDALPVLSIVDGVVLTSRVGVTTRGAARHVVQAVRRVPGAEILGVVANDVKVSEGQHYGYYGHYGHYGDYGSAGKSSRGG
jgi:Mrp family chromosome partitioning ATPase/capsular polysaccharide biosynthesis protein